MMRWLADETLTHLRDVAEWPDLGPRYEVKGRLGRGGMGTVFAAYDRSLDRDVAVKVLDETSEQAGNGAARLLSEATILARLEHPGIVPVHDAGTLVDGRLFYVMKLVRGARLCDELAVSSSSIAQRLATFLRVCDAVSFAHSHGIVHRDLKPENIMLGPFGEVLVMDWGVAVNVGGRYPAEGIVAGTPGFMAPEQEQGAEAVDARADVYALGGLLAAMLPKPMPRALAAIANRARARRREHRYRSVEEMGCDVTRFRDGEPVAAYRETGLERIARFYRRYRVPILLVLVYMIVRVVLLLWLRV
jgi:eukaryotic-like serine/threonine-protein kinase